MPTPLPDLYETDFYAWTRAQARALRRLKAERVNVPLDLDRLASEVRDSGSEQLFAVRSQLVRLLVPQPKPTGSWAEASCRRGLMAVTVWDHEIEDAYLRRFAASSLRSS